jgi:aminoglycoside phosphotransferase (APT) family kinase protein
MDEVALSWVTEVLGVREVHDIRSLAFGVSSNLRLIEVDGTPLVLRRYETDEVLTVVPGVVEDEVRALNAGRPVLGPLVPEPVAFDVTGDRAGRPSLLMTFLPGRPVIHGLHPHASASPLAALHAGPVPSDLSPFHLWFDAEAVAVPPWTRRPDAWSTLADVVRKAPPAAPHVFLHRDYHPGNLLWRDGALTGIVAWPYGCHGPRGVDVAHMRGNLAFVDGVAAADRFLDSYRAIVPGYDHDPWWDVADLFSADDAFSGVIAFNAFGANLDVEILRGRADDWAGALAGAL